VFAVLPTTRDRDLSRVRVDAVLDELGNSFQRVALRQGDDPDCVPVIADSQFTLRFRSTCHESVRFCSCVRQVQQREIWQELEKG
jgi:hypothetical protein